MTNPGSDRASGYRIRTRSGRVSGSVEGCFELDGRQVSAVAVQSDSVVAVHPADHRGARWSTRRNTSGAAAAFIDPLAVAITVDPDAPQVSPRRRSDRGGGGTARRRHDAAVAGG